MTSLSACHQCRGFVPPGSTTCVHCGITLTVAEPRGGTGLTALASLASAGMAAITLMACYGMPPCDEPAPDGGSDQYHCYDYYPPTHCASPAADGGLTDADGGTTDSDGGALPPCEDVFPSPGDAGTGADAGL
ncbi:hypothetical protein F0U62_38165 [Cystobacter fuscus]|uniref:hypothetical protein n=1 Tax=Cystobacter fuscus TaxID=43 RepID=UPI002B2B1AC5|nr:hypothetical protein F0U62_38165 [Cystobacter fuscus]